MPLTGDLSTIRRAVGCRSLLPHEPAQCVQDFQNPK
jgi:hypothetical protein